MSVGNRCPKLACPTRQSGFGLIEMLVVIVIIGIIALVLFPNYFGGTNPISQKKIIAPRDRAKNVATVEYISQINLAIQMYKQDHEDQFPPSLADLKPYGVTDEMMIDQVTKKPLPYDPQTGRVGTVDPYSLGGSYRPQ